VRANAILPGLMDTPMAVDTRARKTGKSRAEVAAIARRARAAAPQDGHRLGRRQRRAVLASDEANFITGIDLLVDGGGALNFGH